MSLIVNDKKFLGYIYEMLLDFENTQYELSQESKELMEDLKTILLTKSITFNSVYNLVPYLIKQFHYYENLSYVFQNLEIAKTIYKEQKYIFSYIEKYFVIKEVNGMISISRNSNEKSEIE